MEGRNAADRYVDCRNPISPFLRGWMRSVTGPLFWRMGGLVVLEAASIRLGLCMLGLLEGLRGEEVGAWRCCWLILHPRKFDAE